MFLSGSLAAPPATAGATTGAVPTPTAAPAEPVRRSVAASPPQLRRIVVEHPRHVVPARRSVAGVRQGAARDACGAVGVKRVARRASPTGTTKARCPRAKSRRDPLADAGAPPKSCAVPCRTTAPCRTPVTERATTATKPRTVPCRAPATERGDQRAQALRARRNCKCARAPPRRGPGARRSALRRRRVRPACPRHGNP